jgi:hypothetical protein
MTCFDSFKDTSLFIKAWFAPDSREGKKGR